MCFVEFFDTTTVKIIIVTAIWILFFLLYRIVSEIREFRHALKYIKTEISRNCGAERRYWQKKKRKLWLNFFFPFIKS